MTKFEDFEQKYYIRIMLKVRLMLQTEAFDYTDRLASCITSHALDLVWKHEDFETLFQNDEALELELLKEARSFYKEGKKSQHVFKDKREHEKTQKYASHLDRTTDYTTEIPDINTTGDDFESIVLNFENPYLKQLVLSLNGMEKAIVELIVMDKTKPEILSFLNIKDDYYRQVMSRLRKKYKKIKERNDCPL